MKAVQYIADWQQRRKLKGQDSDSLSVGDFVMLY